MEVTDETVILQRNAAKWYNNTRLGMTIVYQATIQVSLLNSMHIYIHDSFSCYFNIA